ncbi:AAA family ATPase [Neorhizobium sp. BT27B]|uniref:AAA family ATPase n=1 Tax=Neorhizobium sp. BT27B TaxID=3142625 RepID=UPI003D29676D
MEPHADDSPGWAGKIDYEKLGRRRAAIEPQASRPQTEIKSRFSLIWAHDIGDEDNHKEWVIRDIFGAGEFSYIVGQPGAGKSMCATDMACHLAAGWDWHGFKVRKPGFVLYIAAERAKLTRRRIKAWRKKHRFNDDLPVLVVSGYMNLTDGLEDAKELISVIEQAEDECGLKCGLIVIDTLTRVFGGGDQNTSKDMTRLIDAVSLIQETVPHAHVCVIHHTTHAGTRAKGAIDLDGAVDVSFMVGTKGGVVVLENTGANDGKEGDLLAYDFESVTLGKDDEGEWTTAPVLVPVSLPEANGKGLPPLSKSHRDILEIARELMADKEEPVPGQLVREAYYAKYPDKDRETLKRGYSRAIKSLKDRGLVEASDGFVSITEGH